MTQWLAGMRITAERLLDNTPVALTSTPVAATGFSVSNFTARRAAGSTEWSLILTRTGAALTASSAGNLADTLCVTLPADCRPVSQAPILWETAGIASGACRVAATGDITLTSLDPTAVLATGATVNLAGTFATG